MINNAVALANAAKAFSVPTLLATALKDRGGNLIKPLQDVFPEQIPIDRSGGIGTNLRWELQLLGSNGPGAGV